MPARRLCFWALAFGTIAASIGGATAAEKVSVALNWVPGGDHAAMYYAKKLGWYKDAGIDLDLEAGKGSVGAAQRVSTGVSQIALVDMAVAITARGRGGNLVAIQNIYAESPLGMYWLKSSGIKGIKDFPGKKIGVPPGDAQRALWPALAAKHGIDPASVHWVNVEPNGKVPALKAHAIDITTNFYNLHHVMQKALGDDMGYLSWAKAGVNPYGLTIFVNGDYLKSHRDTVAKFAKITQKAYGACVKEPKPCVEALIEAVGGLQLDSQMVNWKLTMQLMSNEVSQTKGLGYMDPTRMGADYDLATKYLKLEKPFEIKTFYTNEFLDPAIKMSKIPSN